MDTLYERQCGEVHRALERVAANKPRAEIIDKVVAGQAIDQIEEATEYNGDGEGRGADSKRASESTMLIGTSD